MLALIQMCYSGRFSANYSVDDVENVFKAILQVSRPFVINGNNQIIVVVQTYLRGTYQAYITSDGVRNYKAIRLDKIESTTSTVTLALDLNQLLESMDGPDCSFMIARVDYCLERTDCFKVLDVIKRLRSESDNEQSEPISDSPLRFLDLQV